MSMFKLYLLFSILPSAGEVVGIFYAFSIVALIILTVCGIVYIANEDAREEMDEMWVKTKKYRKMFIFSFSILILLMIFIPDQETIVKMYVANYVTTNNQIKQLPKVVIEYLKKETKESE